MIFVTADIHAGHKNIIKYCKRPWADVEQMDDALFGNINRLVRPTGDTLYIIGDFTFQPPAGLSRYRRRINCQDVHLILGNHDQTPVPTGVFSSVSGYMELRHNHALFTLCHYPFRTWNRSHKNTRDRIQSVDLYGHVHNTLPPPPNTAAVDAGVDAQNYAPITLDQALEQARRPYEPGYEAWYVNRVREIEAARALERRNETDNRQH